MKRIELLFLLLMSAASLEAAGYDGLFGWNKMSRPHSIAVCAAPATVAEQMLAASLSGLAAQSVNEHGGDEMVWVEEADAPSSSVEIKKRCFDALKPARIRQTDVWQLLKEYRRRGIVKGYVLYRADSSTGNFYSRREGADYSVNVATVYASMTCGVLIEENLEVRARQMGLRRLKDCRDISPEECFGALKDNLNNRSAVSVDPKAPNCRDYAIACRTMVFYDVTDFSERIMEWLAPLSPIVGWNCAGEHEHTALASRWGHFNTASDWCTNMPLLSAASAVAEPEKVKTVSPVDLTFDNARSYHAYLMSDGDNMQWAGRGFLSDTDFYANPHKGELALTWTSCPVNLSVAMVPVWNTIVDGQDVSNGIIEYCGGYQYPDLFAVSRPNRQELLTEYARRLDYHFKRVGITVLGVICDRVDSDASRMAFETYAREIDDLAGIVAIQYYPYELDGHVLWVSNGHGCDIPVLTARYSIWDAVDANRPRGGTPDYVAAQVNRDVLAVERADRAGELSLTVVHAWSQFDNCNSAMSAGSVRGVDAVRESASHLMPRITVVPVDELLWRVRMRYRPEQTQKIIDKLKQ